MSKRKRRPSSPSLKWPDLPVAELGGIVERARSALSETEFAKLKAAMATLTFLTQELQAKGTTIDRLRRMLFGATTEKTSQVVGETKTETTSDPRPRRRGHGRNGAAAYTGAERVKVPHPTLHGGDCCPECQKGKIYPLAEPATLVRITGMAPLGATVHECDRLRCNLCGEVFTAAAPEGVGEKKYDETATGMVGLLKYGTGLPFNRIEKLQQGMGIPLPATTQWELVSEGAASLKPVHEELIREAAQGEVLFNDDTTMKVLELSGEQRAAAAADEETDGRTGVFTSGIVATREDHHIALFFTGVQHAGENLADVLAKRAAELPKPIQMCDALAANTSGEFESLVAGCTSHARRRYVDVAADFPEECRFVLETLRDVYKHDGTARKEQMSPEARLHYHQAQSGPLMAGLEKWMKDQFEDRRVEPNSGLGEAISYMQTHWEKLTLFLREPGAPLDNNICERALKKAILHRKNALFYKTLNGAHVGDAFMSLIHTAELNAAEPFDYLVTLLRRSKDVAAAPADWMPWNYKGASARISGAGPPA